MLIVENQQLLTTRSHGDMLVHVFRPTASGKFPVLIVFTEIYQVTGPIQRFCRALASHGYICISPETFHDFEKPGVALAYNEEGTAKGNAYKIEKTLESYDDDVDTVVQHAKTRPDSTGRIGVIGMCLGGHLSLRAALTNPEISSAVCFFATDIHSKTLGREKNDNTLELVAAGKAENAEILMIFGRQDPHVPKEGRDLIRQTLNASGANFAWIELNANHAFVRDELSKGRYDAEITKHCMGFVHELFHRTLHLLLEDVSVRPDPMGPGPKKC
jgi:carboxymethylenebutenolidase